MSRALRILRGETDSPGSLEPRGVRGDCGVRGDAGLDNAGEDGVAAIASVLIVTLRRGLTIIITLN